MRKNQDMNVLKCPDSLICEAARLVGRTLAIIVCGTIVVSILAISAVAIAVHTLVLFVQT